MAETFSLGEHSQWETKDNTAPSLEDMGIKIGHCEQES